MNPVITTPDQIQLHAVGLDDLTAMDLRNEAAPSTHWNAYYVVLYDEPGYAWAGERAELLYNDETGRAGISWGADAQWTDCDSAQDAAERFWSVNGKEMSN